LSDAADVDYCVGKTYYNTDLRIANVYIATHGHTQGVEFTIAHELGHLIVDPIVIGGEASHEYLINRMVKAIMLASGKRERAAWSVA
jgi:Zn-dependent peptidase ImmA (M78 family)